jgi:uncharacterized protein
MRLRRLSFGLLLLWPATLWAGKDIPPSPPSYVRNEAVVSPGEEDRLSETLRGFEQATGRQFAVALFQSLDGESLDDYCNRVFRAWKIGGAKLNDGLLFCLFKQDRKWRVEVGYGLEGALTDLQAGEIARDQGVPFFKSGDFDAGVQAVVEALAAKLTGQPMPARADRDGRSDEYPLAGVIYLALFLSLIPILYLSYRFQRLAYGHVCIGRRPRDSFCGSFYSGGGWFGGGGGFGGFSGGGGSSGGGGASGGW